jgi:hypothetical protein
MGNIVAHAEGETCGERIMTNLKRAKLMLTIVVFGLLVSGVTVWPAVSELKLAVSIVWGDAEPSGVLHRFVLRAIEGLESVEAQYPFMLYAHDWLAFAHIVLAILFAGAIRDPVRNVWVVHCGLIMCALVPVLAGICIPIRGLPLRWFWIDFAFAPAAGVPLWIALRDIRRAEAALKPEARIAILRI